MWGLFYYGHCSSLLDLQLSQINLLFIWKGHEISFGMPVISGKKILATNQQAGAQTIISFIQKYLSFVRWLDNGR